MITKFTAANKPAYIIQDVILDDRSTNQQVIGHFLPDRSDSVREGDFIEETEDGKIRLIRFSDYNVNDIIKDEIREKIGKDAMRAIIKAIRTQVGVASDRITLGKLLTTVFMLLGDGFIQDARDMANAEPTTAVFTAPRKAFVLSEIDKAVAMI